MSSPFVAEIRAFGFGFAPKGWAFCDGQLLPLSQNTALFSLLGTFYGGDGKSNFGLPDLQGCIPIMWGQGLSLYDIGQTSGSDTVTLLQSEMPQHNHTLLADFLNGPDNTSPTQAATSNGAFYSDTTTPIVQMNVQAIGPNGGSLAHNNMMPYLTLNFCIALQGVYPARG